MMANRQGREKPPDEDVQEAIEELSGAVETCLNRKETLRSILAELDAARLQGEDVQEDLDVLFTECEELAAVARLDAHGMLDQLLDDAAEYDSLTEVQRDDFESFWADVDWITPAAEAFEAARGSGGPAWTSKDISLDTAQDRLVVQHTLEFGVDTVHEITVPAAVFFADAAQRLGFLARVLPEAVERDDLGAEELAAVLDTRSTLNNVVDQLDELASAQETGNADEFEDHLAAGIGPTESDNAGNANDPTDVDENSGSVSIGFE